MLTRQTLQHFGFSRDPFRNDILFVDDIYWSVAATVAWVAMRDAAKSGGIVSLMGDIYSGKSTLRQMLMQELRQRGDFIFVRPAAIDNERLTSKKLCEAIVGELSGETPLPRLLEMEQQVARLVRERTRSGGKCVLVIEDAHELTDLVLGYLNRLWELCMDGDPLLSIFLIGRPGIFGKLNEHIGNPEELLICRCTFVDLGPLGDELCLYLEHKLKRAGGQFSRLIEVDAIHRRLRRRDGKRLVSEVCPLTVNNLMMRAMNRAAELGEDRVSAEIIRQA